MCHNSSACHAYEMWVELGHCHFCLGYLQSLEMGTRIFLNGSVCFNYRDYGTTTVVLYLNVVHCKFCSV